MLPPGLTSNFEPRMHKYLQQLLPKHLEKKPMKVKEKWSWIKDGKNNKKLSIWFIYSTIEESLLWGLCLSFLKFIYLGFLAWICLRKEEEEKIETKKNPSRKEKGKKRKENHNLVKIG